MSIESFLDHRVTRRTFIEAAGVGGSTALATGLLTLIDTQDRFHRDLANGKLNPYALSRTQDGGLIDPNKSRNFRAFIGLCLIPLGLVGSITAHAGSERS